MIKDLCFEVLDRCPNNCKFCSSNSCIDRNTFVSFEDFKRVIDYFMKKGGIGELSISGGEPFLHPSIFDMIKYSKSLGIKTVVFTSGVKKSLPLSSKVKDYYITEKNARLSDIQNNEPDNYWLKEQVIRFYDRLLNPEEFSPISKEDFKKLEEIGLDKIVFDMQAESYRVDSYLMGRNDYLHSCLITSLAYASFSNIEIDVHFVPMKPNYKEIIDIMELISIMPSASNISILKFVPQGRGSENKKNLLLSEEEMKEFLELLSKGKKLYNCSVRMGIPMQEENIHKCNAGMEKLDIKYDGTVLPCPAFKELSKEIMQRYKIKYYNIYENLEEIVITGGKRLVPLCDRIYK